MIHNKWQYNLAKKDLANFEFTISSLESKLKEANEDSVSIQININAVKHLHKKLHHEIIEFEKLKSGELSQIEYSNLKDLPSCLVQSRIALGLSQKDLAEKLEIKEQQIQRYEQQDYLKASLERIIQVCKVLDIEVSLTKNLKQGTPFPIEKKFLLPEHSSGLIAEKMNIIRQKKQIFTIAD